MPVVYGKDIWVDLAMDSYGGSSDAGETVSQKRFYRPKQTNARIHSN